MKIENKANNSCPYCGSEAKTGMIANSFWKCGNATTDENRRSELCREREAHKQTKSERDEAIKQNATLRDMIEDAIGNAEELTMYGRDLCRNLRQVAVVLRTDLEQIKEGAK